MLRVHKKEYHRRKGGNKLVETAKRDLRILTSELVYPKTIGIGDESGSPTRA
jgi:hypothetical protein